MPRHLRRNLPGSEAYRIVFAKDGGDALEKVKTQSFDLIVTAINMLQA